VAHREPGPDRLELLDRSRDHGRQTRRRRSISAAAAVGIGSGCSGCSRCGRRVEVSLLGRALH